LQRWPAWKGTQLSAAQSALHHGLPDYARLKSISRGGTSTKTAFLFKEQTLTQLRSKCLFCETIDF
jgi:hypothetical protein